MPVPAEYCQAHCCCTQYAVFTTCECLLVLSVVSTARQLPRNTVSNFRQTSKVRGLRAATCIVRTQCHASVLSAPAIGINVYRPILTSRSHQQRDTCRQTGSGAKTTNIRIAYSQSAESSEVQIVRRVRLATVLASRALFATQNRAAHRWRSTASPILIESTLGRHGGGLSEDMLMRISSSM